MKYPRFFAVKLDQATHDALLRKATAERTSASELARNAIAAVVTRTSRAARQSREACR